MKLHPHNITRAAQRSCAFTLLEVIIACTLFFLVAFAVLQLVTSGLVAARKLQQREPDPGIVAADVVRYPTLTEGSGGGPMDDLLPELYPGYSFATNILEIYSNGFFRVDITIYDDRGKASDRNMTIYLYRPGSPPGSASGGQQ